MTVAIPPSMGWSSSRAPNRLVEIQTADLSEMRYTAEAFLDSKVDVRITGESARRILMAMDPGAPAVEYLPTGGAKAVDHQDEALAAARREASEAKRRAAAAESKLRAVEDALQDYEGEIEVLRSELESKSSNNNAPSSFKKLAVGGYVKPGTTFGVTMTPPPAPAPIIEYSQADIDITTRMMQGLSERQAQYQLAR